ncbi:Hypothetical_protein [Hexamita inflata]|uniref:Hypothetical_protein n=1 Tax=Hexamita inflata TaxID=28002 RepID=A0AA86PC25_9EUKA|nr:Hypothetical protein HINF_LOCUS20692 [Hexamita inflata]
MQRVKSTKGFQAFGFIGWLNNDNISCYVVKSFLMWLVAFFIVIVLQQYPACLLDAITHVNFNVGREFLLDVLLIQQSASSSALGNSSVVRAQHCHTNALMELREAQPERVDLISAIFPRSVLSETVWSIPSSSIATTASLLTTI